MSDQAFTREQIREVAIVLCQEAGKDPYVTYDVYFPDDPDCSHGWAPFRQDAERHLREGMPVPQTHRMEAE